MPDAWLLITNTASAASPIKPFDSLQDFLHSNVDLAITLHTHI